MSAWKMKQQRAKVHSAGRVRALPDSAPMAMNERVNVPMKPDMLRELDEWRRRQPDIPNRAEAIRRLIRQVL